MASSEGTDTASRGLARALWLVGAALLALAAVPVPGTTAATTEAAGWWSRTASPLPLNPTSPHVEEGQLHVQGEPEGATAIAALRWALDDDEGNPMLTLTPGDRSLIPPDAIILACRAASPWQDAEGGAWEEAPKVDCETSVTGTVAEDGSSVEFALSPLVSASSLDVVLTPGRRPEGGGGSTFSLTFDRPGPEALQTQSTSSSGSSSDGSFSSPSPSPSPSGSGSFTPSGSPTPAPSGSSFSAPATPAATPEPAAPSAPALPDEMQAAAPSPGLGTPAASTGSAGGGGGDRARNLGLVVLLAGVAVLGWGWMATGSAGTVPAATTAPAAGLVRRREAPLRSS